MASNA